MACFKNNLHKVEETQLIKRNTTIQEWTLIATQHISVGTFIGFYTGEKSQNSIKSLYSVQVNNTFIHPFNNDNNITFEERLLHPLANMNEPNEGESANCCMIVQDFSHDEIENVENIVNHEKARFFRGLACFTCSNVNMGDALTWYYGNSYADFRQSQNYKAGKQCDLLLQRRAFIPSDSQGVLNSVNKVSYKCLFPVFGTHKSERFKQKKTKKRKRKYDSEDSGEDSNSSSGSGHSPKYNPNKNNEVQERILRLSTRNTRKL